MSVFLHSAGFSGSLWAKNRSTFSLASDGDVWLCAGCLHPDYDGYFSNPAEYLAWYAKHGALRDRAEAPTVAVLLYRKHVITGQGYIAQLVRCFEADGVRPVPIFINGIEAHTVVRPLPTHACMPGLLPCLGAGCHSSPHLCRKSVSPCAGEFLELARWIGMKETMQDDSSGFLKRLSDKILPSLPSLVLETHCVLDKEKGHIGDFEDVLFRNGVKGTVSLR